MTYVQTLDRFSRFHCICFLRLYVLIWGISLGYGIMLENNYGEQFRGFAVILMNNYFEILENIFQH